MEFSFREENSTLMEIKESPRGFFIFWNVHSSSQNYEMWTLVALLEMNMIDFIEDRLEKANERYI